MIQIAHMTAEQARAAAEIEAFCFSEPWSEAAILSELKTPGAVMLAGTETESGKLAGYIGCRAVLDEGYINNVAVHPGFRRRGYGGALVSALAAWAKENGLAFLSLEVRISNEAAIALYRAQGFVPAGVRKGFYTAPREDALLMTKYFDR